MVLDSFFLHIDKRAVSAVNIDSLSKQSTFGMSSLWYVMSTVSFLEPICLGGVHSHLSKLSQPHRLYTAVRNFSYLYTRSRLIAFQYLTGDTMSCIIF